MKLYSKNFLVIFFSKFTSHGHQLLTLAPIKRQGNIERRVKIIIKKQTNTIIKLKLSWPGIYHQKLAGNSKSDEMLMYMSTLKWADMDWIKFAVFSIL